MKRNHNVQLSFILSVVVFFTLIPLKSNGTETRTISMGYVGRFIKDNSNIFRYPGTILRYSNQVVAELREQNRSDRYSIGVHLPINSDVIVGAYLNDPLSFPVSISNISPHLNLDNSTSILFGTKLKDYDFGIVATIAIDNWSEDSAADEEKESARYIGITGGISNNQMDFGVSLELPSVSWEMGYADRTWGGFGLGIDGRYYTEKRNNLQLVPFVDFYYGSGEYESDSGIAGVEKLKSDDGRFDIDLGVGCLYQLNDNNLAILGINAFGLSKETEDVRNGAKTTEKWTTLPGLYLGIESQITSWLCGRLGAIQIYQSYSKEVKPQTGDKTEDSEYSSSFELNFGFGIKLGDLTLDLLFNDGLLFDGPNFISGNNNRIANRISAIYEF